MFIIYKVTQRSRLDWVSQVFDGVPSDAWAIIGNAIVLRI